MKAASTTLKNFLAAQQASADSYMAIAECFIITLQTGQVLYYTNTDVDIVFNGHTFSSKGAIVEGLKYRATTGLDIDQQEITMGVNYASIFAPLTVNGVPFMIAMANGMFDLALIERWRVFYSDFIGGTLVDGVLLFKGRFIETKPGRVVARVSVANSLVVLQQSMPRRTFAPTCQHVFGDSFCAVNPAGSTTWTGTAGAGSTANTVFYALAVGGMSGGTITFTSGVNAGLSRSIVSVGDYAEIICVAFPNVPATGDAFTVTRPNSISTTAGAGSTQSQLNTSAAAFLHAGGIVTFTSGLNAGLIATVLRSFPGNALFLATPLPEPVSVGDAFTVSYGCDHTQGMCVNIYNNLPNFLGFPQIPPPQTAFPW